MSKMTESKLSQLKISHQIQKIGHGNVGGKADSLINISCQLPDIFHGRFLDFDVKIPNMFVITTNHFDQFITNNQLEKLRESNYSDRFISHRFLQSSLPVEVTGTLREYISNTHVPLAVRSSSFLEDCLDAPFAGIYYTKMIPNNQPNIDTRFRALIDAIKLVYASTFFRQAKSYSKARGIDHKKEKMAVIIQHIAGLLKNNRFYPDISGVARSYSYYNFGDSKGEDGVVSLALGLGKTIVDGGKSWSYNPQYPAKIPPFNSISDRLKSTQTQFWAVNTRQAYTFNPLNETEFLTSLQIADAEYDNRLNHIASTFNHISDTIVPGINQKGPRVIDFAPILQCGTLPLNELIKEILSYCKTFFSCEIEIEFAITFNPKKPNLHSFSLLQVRPMVLQKSLHPVKINAVQSKKSLVKSKQVMGHGSISQISHIVYTKPDKFSFKDSIEIAKEIDQMNYQLSKTKVEYVLIGFGRWGSSDPWLGIPVNWPQISNAKVIIEVKDSKSPIDYSQGSHFFHNICNLQIFYFYAQQESNSSIDWAWLKTQEIIHDGKYIQAIKTKEPLFIHVDGYQKVGEIFR